MRRRLCSTLGPAGRKLGTRVVLVGLLSLGLAGVAVSLEAQSEGGGASGEWTLEFLESPDDASPTFRSEPQSVTIREAMGAVLATAESFRLLTDLTESRLAVCESTRFDLPDSRILPGEIVDRVGSLDLAVFEAGQVSFTFRTTTDGTEYAITMNGYKPGDVDVSRAESGEIVLAATGAPLMVIRDRAETFICDGAADFTIRLAP